MTVKRSASVEELNNLQALYSAFASKSLTYAAFFDKTALDGLYKAGVIEYEITVNDLDQFEQPPETVKNFTSSSGNAYFDGVVLSILNSIKEGLNAKMMSDELNLSLDVVKDALSILCRLCFTKKIVTKTYEDFDQS